MRAPAQLSSWNDRNSYGVLQTDLLDVQVANLANSLSQDDSTCGGRVGLEFETGVVPEVVCKPMGVEPLYGSFEGSAELRPTR